MKSKKPIWDKEFLAFSSAIEADVPEEITEKIFTQVKRDLHPSGIIVFLKTAAIHAVVGFSTMFFCPQFGIALTPSKGLMPYLMQYGDNACMLGCGALFTALSLLAVSLLLRPEEVRAFRERQVLQLASLTVFSLVAFAFVGGEVIFSLAIAWALGAILGGAISLELGWLFRLKFSRSFA
ncbi:MAG: hypothetical protein ACXWQO_12410 [Bdellovibrionota bacterium]